MTVTYRAGLYMRLSKDDGKEESASIKNQRDILLDYAEKNNIIPQKLYIDDGYSGTNFDRPAFREMIDDIHKGAINMVICKDLSRLGRDYIRTGKLTEEFFPKFNVRFIAINDNFDTDSYDEVAPFKNLINEMYARDISKKIRSAFEIKMKKGDYIGNFPPFGYKKSLDNKNRLEPDTVAAEVVNEIYTRYVNGETAGEIASQLNSLGTITPSLRRRQLYNSAYPISLKWSAAAVLRILKNPIYSGKILQGKTRKLSFKSNVVVPISPENWILGAQHSPILFNSEKPKKNHRRTPLHSKIDTVFFCGSCGKKMCISNSTAVCSSYKSAGKKKCLSHRINLPTLEQAIRDEFPEFCYLFAEKIIIDEGKIIVKIKKRAD